MTLREAFEDIERKNPEVLDAEEFIIATGDTAIGAGSPADHMVMIGKFVMTVLEKAPNVTVASQVGEMFGSSVKGATEFAIMKKMGMKPEHIVEAKMKEMDETLRAHGVDPEEIDSAESMEQLMDIVKRAKVQK